MDEIYHQWISRARSPHTARTYQQSLDKWVSLFGAPPTGDTKEVDLDQFLKSMVSWGDKKARRLAASFF